MRKPRFKNIFIYSLFITFWGCQPLSDNSVAPSPPSNTTQTTQENSCSVSRVSSAEVRIACPDGSSEIIKDGSNGINGTNGLNGINGVDAQGLEVIDPCGPESKIGFDEILIRFPDRTILAYFKFETYEHLARLVPGRDYVTTDDTKCEFKIDDNGTIYDARGGKY